MRCELNERFRDFMEPNTAEAADAGQPEEATDAEPPHVCEHDAKIQEENPVALDDQTDEAPC